MAREAITELYDLFRDLDRRIASFDKKIDCVFRGNEDCQRIARIKGVGPKTATAIVAAVGDGSEFKNGRHLAAWVGLVFTAPALLCARRQIKAIRTISGSISFGSGVASTAQQWRSPTKMHGSSGPCFERASHTAPLAEDLPQSLRDDGEMNCTGRTGAQRA